MHTWIHHMESASANKVYAGMFVLPDSYNVHADVEYICIIEQPSQSHARHKTW